MRAMEIKKNLTKYNLTKSGNTKRIKYIVIHYVGATGDAEANCKYYASKYLGASAHYFVGFKGDIWQCVEDGDIAWHCGTSGAYKHPTCRNSNAIGIEMCVKKKNAKSMGSEDKDWYFEAATVQSAVALTKKLMKKYGVPAKNIIRHYDVTGKICPNPFVYNNTEYTWNKFKKSLEDDPKVKAGGGGVVASAKCRLFKQQGTWCGKVCTIPQGTEIKHIKDEGKGWSSVQCGKDQGYMRNSCISGVKGLSKCPTVKVTKATYLRTGRKADKSTRICKLPKGTDLKIIAVGKNGKWTQVRDGKKKGYVVTSKIK